MLLRIGHKRGDGMSLRAQISGDFGRLLQADWCLQGNSGSIQRRITR